MSERHIFRDLASSDFPFTIAFRDHDTDELLRSIEVTGPGAIDIPGFSPRRVDVTITYADGHTERLNYGAQ